VGGGGGEPANHVLEAGERALVAVVASPAQRGGGARTGPARRRGRVGDLDPARSGAVDRSELAARVLDVAQELQELATRQGRRRP
jgi:hypothetical protein